MKYRVLYIIDNLEYGGGERIFAQLATRLDSKCFEAAVAASPGGRFQREIEASGVAFYPVDFSRIVSWKALRQLAQACRQFVPHLAHSQGKRADLNTALVGRWTPVPHKVCKVTMPIDGYPIHPLKKSMYRLVDHWVERQFDKIHIVSSATEELLVKNHGISPEKIAKIPNGVDLALFDPARMTAQEARQSLGLPMGNPLVGFVGRLVWQKGIDLLIDAAPHVLRELPEARFVLIGDGPLERELRARARRLGIEGRVLFLGLQEKIPEFLSAVDLLAMPSLQEGLPIALLEAMAMGKPIVASDIDGIREAAIDGKTALLVPPRDAAALALAIVRLLRDQPLAAHLGADARERARAHFSVEAMLRRVEAMYEEVIRGAKPI